MRVGATAGVAANYMARENARSVGMFGSGGMARTYLEAFVKVRKIDYCRVYSPTPAHREAYAAEMSDKLDIDVVAVDSPDQVTQAWTSWPAAPTRPSRSSTPSSSLPVCTSPP